MLISFKKPEISNFDRISFRVELKKAKSLTQNWFSRWGNVTGGGARETLGKMLGGKNEDEDLPPVQDVQ